MWRVLHRIFIGKAMYRKYTHSTYCIDALSQFCCKYFASPFVRIIESDLRVLLITRWTNHELLPSGWPVHAAGPPFIAIKAGINQWLPARLTFVSAQIGPAGILFQWLMTIAYRADLYGFWSILCIKGILQFLNVVDNDIVRLQSETLMVLRANESDIV